MTTPGFSQDYEIMARASREVRAIADRIQSEQSGFPAEASLDYAIPTPSEGVVGVLPVSLLGPDLDRLSTLIASTITGTYQQSVDAIAEFLTQASATVRDTADKMTRSIDEYRRADEASQDELRGLRPPR